MKMAKIDNILLKSKFRGCLLGGLIGDCFGAPFEGEEMSAGDRKVVQKYFNKLDGPPFKAPVKKYTDDTAMTKSVAKCLIDKPAVDYKFMAKLFVKEFYMEPKRGYGQAVGEVFNKLRLSKFEDIYKPAREQFNGSGSYGNGGAMRIAPIALYFHNNYDAMLQAAEKSTEITHANKLGINGALLQCLAIQQSLMIHPTDKIDEQQFASQLVDKMRTIELDDDDGLGIDDSTAYQTQLGKVITFLNNKESTSDEEIIETLGNSVTSLYSVPTAIYCFLRAQTEIEGIETDNMFRRAIQYAITLGGDTDTIASMAGAIAGAYLGEECISENILQHCEFRNEMLEIADNLYTVTEKLECD